MPMQASEAFHSGFAYRRWRGALLTAFYAIAAVSGIASCSSPPPVGGTGGTGGCVQNVLCVRGDHFDPVLCRCVPDQDAGGVQCGSRMCAANEQCCSPSC